MRSRQRGSAIIFVIVFMGAITTVLVAASSLSTNALKVQTRREEAAGTLNAFDGAVDQIVADYSAGTLSIPVTKTITVGSIPMSVTITDNSAVTPHTLKVDASTTVNGRSYTYTRVVGMHATPSPFYYSLVVNSTLNPAFAITAGSGGSNGDVSVNGDAIFLLGGHTVNGDLECSTLTGSSNVDVKGSVYEGISPIPFPTVKRTNYQSVAYALYPGGSTIGNYTFPNVGVASYKVLYVAGNCNLKGSFTGQGVVYVAGSVTITGDVTYGSATSCVAIIAEGSISFGLSATNIAGFYYTNNSFSTAGLTPKTITRGNIVCQSLVLTTSLTINGDPWVWNTPTEGARLRLPGMWP